MAGPGSDAGLRPLVLCGTLYAAGLVAAWVPWFLGFISLDVEFSPVAWHAHELLFGFAPAVIAGSLPVTGPNGNGRPPSLGIAAWLFAAWVAGRLGVAESVTLGPLVTALAALLFPLSLAAIGGRKIPVGNLRVLTLYGVLCLLTGAQILFHWELWRYGQSICGTRLAAAAMATLVILSGGWIPAGDRDPEKTNGVVPAPYIFLRLNRMAIGCGLLALAAWVVQGSEHIRGQPSGALLLVAHVACRWRQRMAGPFVFISHVVHAFVPAGFLFAAGSAFTAGPVYSGAAMPAWTLGAIGILMLTVETYSLPERVAFWPPAVVFSATTLAIAAQIAAALIPQQTMLLMPLSGVAWIIAFLLLGIAHWRSMLKGV